MHKILIVDDNDQITSMLSQYAIKEGFEPIIAKDGMEALEQFSIHKPDIILLDVMMPKIDGFEVCRTIRSQSNVPVIMITARGEDFEKIMGLDIGADDYIVKPFSNSEVMARVRAILRRIDQSNHSNQQSIYIGNLEMNLDRYQAKIDHKIIDLTRKEFDILWTLAINPDQVFSRDQLLDKLWGFDYYGDTRTVDSHVKRLRFKVDCFDHPKWNIKTIWGVGYKLEVQDD